jgi:hypothetical protein
MAGRATERLGPVGWSVRYKQPVLFLGEDLMAWIVLALGAALAGGTALALVRPPPAPTEGDLERPPLARSLAMIVLGTLAAIWALASLVAG